MKRAIETHHYVTRLNEDFLQCAVFDSDGTNARLLGVEYIISYKIFSALPEEERKLWHSHLYEIKHGLWINPGVPEALQRSELEKLAGTYGKFWCTWQSDRGDKIPLGLPVLMMSPQESSPGLISEEAIRARDKRYDVSSTYLAQTRADIDVGLGAVHPSADHWKKNGKGFVIELKEVDMVKGSM
ncbi:hypothetical protein KP509_23G086500 [Ceratopteris richardii]|nr:hypothetical protein KP509_23G086500 [Ceratopteris richardii]